MNERVYLLKIQLLDIEPAIWRRFTVPACITLDRLHDVIQVVMGWKDSHLYEFTISNKRYTEEPETKEQGLECGLYRLGELIKRKGRVFNYLYDFGDGWEHEITIEDSRYSSHDSVNYFCSKQIRDLMCLDGQRACPPEDVGGTYGYLNFLNALREPKHERHEEYTKWSGGNFDSELFELERINLELMKYLRWSRDRYQLYDDFD